jgi:hypothetical protein
LPTLVITIPSLEIFLFCQHNSTCGGNLELKHVIVERIQQTVAAEIDMSITLSKSQSDKQFTIEKSWCFQINGRHCTYIFF